MLTSIQSKLSHRCLLWMGHTNSHQVRFLVEERYEPPCYQLQLGSPVPDIVHIKDFIHWCIDSTKGRLSENKKPTMTSTLACAKRFFGGFEEATKSEIVPSDREEIYVCNFLIHHFHRRDMGTWMIPRQAFQGWRISQRCNLHISCRPGECIMSESQPHREFSRY